MIDVSRISSKGQVTIPVEIRKTLNLKEGSKVAFITDENNKVYIVNSALLALKEAQVAFSGVANQMGLKDENEVPGFINDALNEG